MKKLVALVLFTTAVSATNAQPNWAQHVAPILYEHCTSCHHSGGIAPFSLMTYEDAYNEAEWILHAVEDGHMPPWPPDSTYQQYAHQRILNADEINTIIQWVDLGLLQGDLALAPPPPVYSSDGYINLPHDLELSMPTYISNATEVFDDYSCFAIPTELLQSKKIRAYEVIPGNPSIVHHALVFIDPTAAYPTNTSGLCMGPNEGLIGGYTPGAVPTIFPSNGVIFNLGVTIPAGANIVLAMHYPNGSQGIADQTKIRFWFYPDATDIREVETNSILQNWSFTLPPNQITTVEDDFNFIPADASVLSVFPHMHLLGESIESYAVTPSNDTIPFVKINHWDFHWQQFFYFKNLLRVPAWSTMYGKGVYNNTSDNPHNPNFPPVSVGAGLNTTDEMFLIYFQFLPYLPGDELQDLEALTQMPVFTDIAENEVNSNLSIFPNPAFDVVQLELNLDAASLVSIYLYNLKGTLIKKVAHQQSLPGGKQILTHSVSEMIPGAYFYSLNINGKLSTGKLMVVAE